MKIIWIENKRDNTEIQAFVFERCIKICETHAHGFSIKIMNKLIKNKHKCNSALNILIINSVNW